MCIRDRLIIDLNLESKVNVLGKVDNVVEFYRESDIFLLPSLQEGLPLVVLEAMACGLPVVASSVDGTPEAVLHGETGFLVDVRSGKVDLEKLRKCIKKLLDDKTLRASMGDKGRERVVKEFSKEGYEKQLIEFLAESLGECDDN